MRVTVTSCMRNATHYIDRYFRQVAGLYDLLAERGDRLEALIGEGDSTDPTRQWIVEAFRKYGVPGKLIDTTHGGPMYGSVVDAQRFAQMAYCYNRVWRHIPADADAVLFVEADLMWKPAAMVALLDALQEYPAVSPRAMHREGCRLYGTGDVRAWHDTWGFVYQGEHFTNLPPYHPDLNGEPLHLDSAGSCIALRGELARSLHFPAEDMVVGMTKMAGGVTLLPELETSHP